MTTRKNQTGLVSIMVTMILMIVITLIVLGFAQVSRRNQRETLDRQLSTQAYYAAESGINDAYKAFTNPATPVVVPAGHLSAPCDSFITANHLSNSLGNGVKYTCLLADNMLPTLQYDDLQPGGQTVVPLTCALADGSGCNVQTITFSWQPRTNTTGLGTCPAVGTFTPNNAANWGACHYGIVQVDLVPTQSAGVDAASLINNTKTYYLAPGSAGSPVSGPSVSLLGSTGCATTCQTTITAAGSLPQYYARITMLYADTARLSINGHAVGGGTIYWNNGQILLDATGQAQDELRRIQVRLPLGQTTKVPTNSLQTGGPICKRFSIIPGGTAQSDTANPLCSN